MCNEDLGCNKPAKVATTREKLGAKQGIKEGKERKVLESYLEIKVLKQLTP